MYTVYKHTTPSGKVYIGITSEEPERRWRNGNGYHHNAHFTAAIHKYGWNNIKHEILFNGITQEEAEAKEVELISLFHSNDRKYGYNQSSGGEKSAAGRHYEMTAEHRKSLSNSHKGKKASIETRIKMSNCHKGSKNYFYGKHHSEETKKKLSAAHIGKEGFWTGKKLSDEHKQKLSMAHSKRVMCIETGELYISTVEAHLKTGIPQTSISSACRGVYKTAGGFHWEYVKSEVVA